MGTGYFPPAVVNKDAHYKSTPSHLGPGTGGFGANAQASMNQQCRTSVAHLGRTKEREEADIMRTNNKRRWTFRYDSPE